MNRTQTHELGQTVESTKNKIQNIVQSFQTDHPEYKIQLRFSRWQLAKKGKAIGLPTTKPSKQTVFDDGFKDTIPIKIGVRGLSEKDKPDNAVNDAIFARIIFVTQHELSHIEQALETSTKNDNGSQTISIQRLAMTHNRTLYEKNHNLLLSENDADYNGITKTVEYMKKEFPNIPVETIDDIITQGILLEHKKPGMHIQLTGDVLQNTTELKDAILRRTIHASAEPPKFPQNYEKYGDELSALAQIPEWKDLIEDIQRETQPDPICTKLACIQCYLHPHMRLQYPNTSSLNLSPEAVLGHTMPQSREQTLKKYRLYT